MFKIGVTGGIGTGKTYICSLFEKWFEAPVYYTDEEARRLMEQDPELVREIKSTFGEEAYIQDKLNRVFMRGLVFGDKLKLELLNALVHPVVRKDLAAWFKSQQHQGKPYAMVESAILFEGGMNRNVDYTIVVSSWLRVRMERIQGRDSCSVEQAQAKIDAQMPQEEKEKLADYIVSNNGGSNDKMVDDLVELNKKFGGNGGSNDKMVDDLVKLNKKFGGTTNHIGVWRPDFG